MSRATRRTRLDRGAREERRLIGVGGDAMSDAMHATARELVAPGKGILAADESTGTIKKRFDSIGVESTEENRRQYRQMLFGTPGLGEHISGVILYGETVTQGLDGLRERLAEYVGLGARFAKWRATILIGDGLPTEFAIDANAHAMARYAALCQEAGLVPIVEPEVLMDGDHTIERCEEVTTRTLQAAFREMTRHRLDLAGALLKVNMVLSGKDCPVQTSHEEVAERTVRSLGATVPVELPGVVFLSGGMGDEDATIRLNEMNGMGAHPWELSFSYGRALQAPALKAWAGDAANVRAGQRALAHRAKMNGFARSGSYSPEMESAA